MTNPDFTAVELAALGSHTHKKTWHLSVLPVSLYANHFSILRKQRELWGYHQCTYVAYNLTVRCLVLHYKSS